MMEIPVKSEIYSRTVGFRTKSNKKFLVEITLQTKNNVNYFVLDYITLSTYGAKKPLKRIVIDASDERFPTVKGLFDSDYFEKVFSLYAEVLDASGLLSP